MQIVARGIVVRIAARSEPVMPVHQAFEAFVQTPSTALAYRICPSTAGGDSSPRVLVLFGAPGGGTTHLLCAMAVTPSSDQCITKPVS